MSVMETILVPKHKRAPGAPPVVSPARPSLDGERATRLATYAKALADPIRVQLVDVLAEHPGELCACELLAAVRCRPIDALASPQDARRRRHPRDPPPRPVRLLHRPPARTCGWLGHARASWL